MITSQKITSLGFALYDGKNVPEEKLTQDQKAMMVKYVTVFRAVRVAHLPLFLCTYYFGYFMFFVVFVFSLSSVCLGITLFDFR